MKIDHWQHVALVIRAQIDISEGVYDEEDEADADDLEDPQFHNIILGAKQQLLSFSTIESSHSEDAAFKKFQERFCKYLSAVFPRPKKTSAAYMLIFTQDTRVSQIIS
jgi:hypothetical protein